MSMTYLDEILASKRRDNTGGGNNGILSFSGALGIKKIPRKTIGLWYKIKNLPHIIPGWLKWRVAKALNIATFLGTLELILIKANGEKIDYGIVSTRVVTTEFVNFLVDELAANNARFQAFKYHGSGTGTTAEAIGDTALETQVETRATGTQAESAANAYQSVGTVSYTGTRAITEHGLFSAASGTDELMDRSVFAAVNVVNQDSIQFTYTLTASAGG